jgi:hypothetical protein
VAVAKTDLVTLATVVVAVKTVWTIAGLLSLFFFSAAVEIIQTVAVAVATASAKLCRKCLTSCN